MIGEAGPDPLPDAPPLLGVHVTAYDVGVLPLAGAGPKVTFAVPLPGVTPVIAGAPGTVAATTAADGADGGLAPTALVALTLHR